MDFNYLTLLLFQLSAEPTAFTQILSQQDFDINELGGQHQSTGKSTYTTSVKKGRIKNIKTLKGSGNTIISFVIFCSGVDLLIDLIGDCSYSHHLSSQIRDFLLHQIATPGTV